MPPKRASSPAAASKRSASPAAKRGASASTAAPTISIPRSPRGGSVAALSPRSAQLLANKSGLPADILARTPRAASPSGRWKLPLLPPAWIVLWFVLNSLVVLWDASFVLLRPLSLPGQSPFAWIWTPYHTYYMPVDGQYGVAGWAATQAGHDMWNVAQSYCNLFEVALTGLFLLLANYNDPASSVVGIIASTATGYKTAIYFLLEALSGFKYTRHNDALTFWTSFVLPSSIWIIFPALVIATLTVRIAGKL